jgi:succinate-semialdehyde dehydrogenase/glutarate-semialdehyde dehydrogenase
VGDGEHIAEKILAAPQVRKLTFTGSCETGEKLYRLCTPTFKKVTLELGGHAPLLVFEDADLDRAVRETIRAKFRISGQTCICANRILVHKKVHLQFIEKLSHEVKKMRVGSPLDEATDLSNVLHPTSNEKVKHHVQDALNKGATRILGSEEPYQPTILNQVTPSMVMFREETFGPVAGITAFSSEEEALHLANDTIYGLASYVFTQDLNRAERVVSKLEYGIVGLNDGLPSAPNVPFGGIKYSGFGREGGPKGIFEYVTEKLISQKVS